MQVEESSLFLITIVTRKLENFEFPKKFLYHFLPNIRNFDKLKHHHEIQKEGRNKFLSEVAKRK